MPKLKELLKDKLTEKQLELVPSSYDIVGDILIFVDFPKQLVKYDNIIAEKLFSINKNIKVIVKKTKKYSGKYRLPRFKIIAGENRLETEFKENGCRFKIDI